MRVQQRGGAELKFKASQIKSEHSEYIVYSLKEKKKVGKAEFYLREEEGKRFVPAGNKQGGKAKVIIWEGKFSYPKKKIEINTYLHPSSFLLLSSFKKIETNKDKYRIETKYLPHRATILLINTNRKPTKLTLDLPYKNKIYDNDSLLFILRFLNFEHYIYSGKENKKDKNFSILIPEIGQTTSLNLKISKSEIEEEIADLPILRQIGKKFKSVYLVELKDVRNSDKQFAWYAGVSPHYLLKYKNKYQEYVLNKVESLE